MNSFEINKIIGAVLGTLLFVMGAGLVAEAIFHPLPGNGPGYALPEPEIVAAGEEDAPVEIDIGTLLASASAERGQGMVARCAGCHNFGEGQPNKTGPGLYELIGRLEGSHEGFAYSDALLAHKEAGDVWTYENLNHFLTKPAAYAPGTKMNFPGIANDAERADLIAYLSTLSSNPVAYPEPAPAIETAPAEGAEAAGAIATPTETQSETAVQGTATTSGTPAATEAAPAADPAAEAAPAEAAPAEAAPAEAAPAPEPEAPAERVIVPQRPLNPSTGISISVQGQ